MDASSLVVASNRGPVSFARAPDGSVVGRKGGGGLVASLGPLLEDTGALWVAAAMSEADRQVASSGVADTHGLRYLCLDIEPATYRQAYDVIANSALWFVHHHLFDLPRRPRFDRRWQEAWEGYRAYNSLFAAAIAESAPDGATVLVQDYHLTLLAAPLSRKRPDLKLVHFHHTPFAEPSWLAVLPDRWAGELLEGLSAFAACGFHSTRWESAFRACCESVLGQAPPTFVSGLPAAAADLERVAASAECAEEGGALDRMVGGRRLIVRVDRMELSKNIVRGFWAFDELLERRADLRSEVVFSAFCYPSREGLADYLAYHQEVLSAARMVNERWATPDWTPVTVFDEDNFARSVAALQRYDVLLVNPVRDGMNLVAKEGALLNRRDGLVALSRQAGVWDELGEVAFGLNPFDVSDTAEALEQALDMTGPERRTRSRSTATAAGARSLPEWLDDQVGAAG